MQQIDLQHVLSILDHEIFIANYGQVEPMMAKDITFNPSTLDFRVRTVVDGDQTVIHFKNAEDAMNEYNGKGY